MNPGDLIDYAAHPVVSQEDGSFLPIDEEQWLPGKALAVDEHPLPIDAGADAVPDVVALVEPDGGEPPFHLNAKLVRPAERKRRTRNPHRSHSARR